MVCIPCANGVNVIFLRALSRKRASMGLDGKVSYGARRFSAFSTIEKITQPVEQL